MRRRQAAAERLGIYIHIPFCRSKCDYCDFYSLAGQEGRMDEYQRALLAHLRETAPMASSCVVDTVYFGGGTPSWYGAKRLRELLAFLDSRGIPVSQVSGASTGTVEFKAGGSVYTELQAGSYLFMDSAYHRLGLRFQNALFIQATVISTAGGRIVTDAGIKCCGVDQGPPVFVDFPSCVPVMSEEHSAIYPSEHSCRPGDRLTLIPGHCCTTMNLHDRVFLTRGGCVMDCIPITSRGKCM